jgi:hypothetical protein
MFSGAAEAAFAAFGFRQFVNHFESNFRQLGDYHLGNPFAAFDVESFFSGVIHDHTHFAAVTGIDSSGRIGQHQVMFQSQSATGSYLSLEAERQFDK